MNHLTSEQRLQRCNRRVRLLSDTRVHDVCVERVANAKQLSAGTYNFSIWE